jgi:DNA-directed RNA polymerase specialized sigma24 family protein
MRNDSNPHADFPTTQWSRVARAEDPSALAELCAAYWYPIYALIRRKGHTPEESADLTQDYFARLIEKRIVGFADRGKGRFRSFLRTDCGFFLADQHDRDRAIKRGGRIASLSISVADAESRYRFEPVDDGLTPDRLFDRAYALKLLDRVLGMVEREFDDAGNGAMFHQLRFILTDGPGAVAYASIAVSLSKTEAAIQQAASRLRKRYRCVLREQIAATLEDPSESAVNDEICDLFSALGS